MPTEYQGVKTRSQMSVHSRIELEFGNVGFLRGKPEYPEKASQSREENQQQTQSPHMTPAGLGIEPTTHWWETSALTTAPPLKL